MPHQAVLSGPAGLEDAEGAQEIETLRLVARGVAHDLNNLLALVVANVELALDPTSETAFRDECLRAILDAADHARGLTTQLLELAHPTLRPPKPYDVARVLADSVSFVLAGSRVTAPVTLPEDLWCAMGDPARLRRVIDNLLLNARQAMPAGGRVSITAGNVSVPPETPAAGAGAAGAGRFIEIRVTDNGPGIPQSVQRRLFSAQVSTKDGGLGLGLATCRSVIEEDGGSIHLESAVGNGATFSVRVRAAPDGLEEEQPDTVRYL